MTRFLVLLLLLATALPAAAVDVPEYVIRRSPAEVTRLPASGSRIAERRPPVGALLERPLRWYRLTVDGQDVTGLATLESRALVWKPGYDLDLGTHEVVLQAVDALGQGLARTWEFHLVPPSEAWPARPRAPAMARAAPAPLEVASSSLPDPELEGGREADGSPAPDPAGEDAPVDQDEQEEARIPLVVTNPKPDQAVGRIFNVQGDTAPGARLLVEVWDPPVAMEPLVTAGGGRVTVFGTADASGHFDIPLDTRDGLTRPDAVRLTVASVAPDGRGASPVFFELTFE